MSQVFHLLDEREVFSDHAGGAISRWAANMLREGREIIVCPSFDPSWGFPTERLYVLPGWSRTGPVHPILYRLPWVLQKFIYQRVFEPLVKKLGPGDIVYVHNRPACAAVLAVRSAEKGFTVVLHMHNSHLILANRGQKRALLDTPIVFVSEYLRTELKAAWPEHRGLTSVVYNGADEKMFRSEPRVGRNVPEVIFTGRLIPEKGVHVLVEAMRLLEKKGVPVRCTLVGGAGFGKRRKTAYVCRLEKRKGTNTVMVGYHAGSRVAELLRNADIYCLPSIWKDPFPLSVLEALATGMPVVASRAGGIPEELGWGGGLLVEPNQPEALAEAIETLALDPAMRERLGAEASAASAQHFTWSVVREQYKSFLRELGWLEAE